MRPLSIGAGQFAAFRAAFGAYLAVHFIQLWAWAPELFSREGVWPSASLSPLTAAFPNVLSVWDRPWQVQALVAALAGLSLLLALGWRRSWVCVGLWYGWTCLFVRQPLISNPGLPYVGLLLLLCALVPEGEGLSVEGREARAGWSFPRRAWDAAFWVLMLGYSYSGLVKLGSPSWLNGDALILLADNPLARTGPIRDLLKAMPPAILRVGTWSALALEIAALPLCLVPRLRPWVWAGLIGLHLGILGVIDFADLTLGMLFAHAFTYHPAWNPAQAKRQVLFFDGVCGLCDGVVRALLSADRGAVLQFAPLQGPTAAAMLQKGSESEPQSLVYAVGGRELRQGAALRALLRDLGGPLALVGWGLHAVPLPVLDAAYRFVAKRRYGWFGRFDACRLPRAGEKERFLP